MCGICGVVARDPALVPDAGALARMRDLLVHRGPDDAGAHLAPGVALGVRRLAIVDLSPRGHMPMTTPDGRYTIVYNGEVYNADALRSALEAAGCAFRSRTDTEVLLHLFAREGPAMLDRLNGMFAFAVWDARERRLFVARDRLGVKPLYYAVDGERLVFASEAKALFAAGLVPTFDPETWTELLCFRHVAGERTPYAGVQRLLPGHYLTWQDGALRTARWWHLGAHVESRRGAADAAAWYRATFDDAIALRRIADVPVGVLLSGGLDSGSVAAALAAQAGAGVASFTVTFDEPGYDEGPLARQVAARWGLEAHTLTVPTDELLPRLLQASWLNDEPLAHGNELHLLAIAAHARPHVTVLLSGEGADETLGGYVRYRPLLHPTLLGAAGTPPAAALARLLARIPGAARFGKLARLGGLGDADAWVLYDACDLLPDELEALGAPPGPPSAYRAAVQSEARAAHPGDLLRQAMYLDQHTFLVSLLDRNDRMTMGASIECRVPFLDYRLVEGLAALPTRAFVGRRSKPLLRTALGDRLPAAVLQGRKWGFGVPWGRHLRETPALRDVVAQLPAWSPLRDLLPRRAIEAVVREFLGGDRRRDALVRQLALVRLWHEACVTGRPAVAPLPAPLPAPNVAGSS